MNIYESGDYAASNPTWHAEMSPWKASQVHKALERNGLRPKRVVEIGCGAGGILTELADKKEYTETHFFGFDIAPDAIKRAQNSKNVKVLCEDFFEQERERYDVAMILDVFEHVQDYVGFVKRCRNAADYKLYHVPLDLHVSSILRRSFIQTREKLGHLHYFTRETALATIEDAGHEIIDSFFTNASFSHIEHRPTVKRLLAAGPRWLGEKVSPALTARLIGGFSLMVLAK